MANGTKTGSIFIELSLDATKYTIAQKEILAAAEKNSADIGETFKRVGTESDKIYNAMRQSVQNSLDAIKRSHLTTAEEKVRAEQSATAKIKQINEQQFGHQTSLLDTMKKNYVATAAVIVAAWMAVNKAMSWAEIGAKAQQAEESFRQVADAANESADRILAGMKRAAQGTVDDSDIMQKAVKGMVLGLKGDEMVKIMEAARVSARVAGEDVKEAYENITNAIVSEMPRVLRKYGLVMMDEMTLIEQAMKAGVKHVDIYSVAMMNAGIQAAKMGALNANAAEGVQIFKAQVKELTETIGKFVIELGTRAFVVVKSFAAILTYMAAPIAYLIGGQEAWNAMLASGNDLLEQAGKLAGENAEHAKAAIAASSGEVERLQAEKKAWLEKLKAQIEAQKGAKDHAKEIENLNKRIIEDTRKSAAEIEGIGKTIFEKEMERIESQSTAWKKAGASRIAVEKWVANEVILARKKQDDDMAKMEREIADAIAAIRLTATKKALDNIMAGNEEELRRIKNAEEAFEKEIGFYAQLIGFEDTYYAKKLEWIEKERAAKEVLYGMDAANAWRNQEVAKTAAEKWEMENEGINSVISNTQKMFDSASELFERDSKEFQAMQTLKKVAYVAEMAMNVSRAASALSVAMAQNAANTSVAITGAASSVAAQGQVPIAGFALAAAMAAFMASILAASGIAWGGGGGAAAPVLPPSTVLGAEAGTGSESISKVWELLEDTYDLEYRELTGIHNSVDELNRNITGLVTSIVRTGGVGGFETGSVSSGIMEKLAEKYVSGTINFFTLGLFGGLADKIGGWIGGIVGSIFGGGRSQSLEGAGIEFRAATAGELIAGKYLDALQYEVIKTVKDGGWFHSDKTSYETIYRALDESVSRMFTLVFHDMSKTLLELAKGLGTDVQQVLSYVFKGEQIDLRGKTSEEINKVLSEYFSKVADVAVETLFGDIIAKYQKLNEGMFETAARLIKDKAVVYEIIKMTNQQFFALDAGGLIAFSEALIAIAGGLDKLTEAAATYYDKFFTDEEKQARLQAQLSAALGDLGMRLPTARDGYRALVEGLNLNTEAGKEAYVTLLKLAGSADDYYSALEDIIPKQDKLAESLRKQAATITQWIDDMNRSSLAPVTSMEMWRDEYERQKTLAASSGATGQDVSGFLNYAKDYLAFMRSYGGDYQAIYQSVIGDVQSIGEMKDTAAKQLEAIVAADMAARESAARVITTIQGSWTYYPPGEGQTARPMAAGGLTRGITIAGEMGPGKPEWIVPTYEPQRSRFLESVPASFWENLSGGGAVYGGGGGDITIRLVNVIDGKVLSDSVAKQIPRNPNLSDAIRRVN